MFTLQFPPATMTGALIVRAEKRMVTTAGDELQTQQSLISNRTRRGAKGSSLSGPVGNRHPHTQGPRPTEKEPPNDYCRRTEDSNKGHPKGVGRYLCFAQSLVQIPRHRPD